MKCLLLSLHLLLNTSAYEMSRYEVLPLLDSRSVHLNMKIEDEDDGHDKLLRNLICLLNEEVG